MSRRPLAYVSTPRLEESDTAIHVTRPPRGFLHAGTPVAVLLLIAAAFAIRPIFTVARAAILGEPVRAAASAVFAAIVVFVALGAALWVVDASLRVYALHVSRDDGLAITSRGPLGTYAQRWGRDDIADVTLGIEGEYGTIASGPAGFAESTAAGAVGGAMLVVVRRDGSRDVVNAHLTRHQVWPLLQSLRRILELPPEAQPPPGP